MDLVPWRLHKDIKMGISVWGILKILQVICWLKLRFSRKQVSLFKYRLFTLLKNVCVISVVIILLGMLLENLTVLEEE